MTIPETPDTRSQALEGQTFAATSRLMAYLNFVKLPHTVFALPFALVGVVLASYRYRLRLSDVGWVVLAFTAARFAAMGFNRIVDRELDARNPRTAMRELPRGTLSLTEASVAVAVASLLFVYAAFELNPLCLALSPVALGWIFFYSFTKRFTRWSHLVLGLGLGIAPVGGYLAVSGVWARPWWMLVVLSIAVMTWVAGFDILYALQDREFDREEALHSVPAALGERGAIQVSRALHVGTLLAFAVVGATLDLGWPYWTGVALAGALLAYEHSLVKPGDLSRLDAAFFTMNGMISVAFFLFVLLDRIRPLL